MEGGAPSWFSCFVFCADTHAPKNPASWSPCAEDVDGLSGLDRPVCHKAKGRREPWAKRRRFSLFWEM
jgi:hypothetical protein